MAKKGSNITALADRLNLSKGTVSRILNGDSSAFAEETRIRVQTMAAEVGYTPNLIARALATGKTGSVGVWLRHLKTSYHAQVTENFENLIEADSYRMNLRFYQRDMDRGLNTSLTSIDSVDGIICHGKPPESWMNAMKSNDSVTPMVFSGDYFDPYALDYVFVGLADASNAAVRHLVESGRKRIAFVSPYWSPIESQEPRIVAYRDVMRDAGLATEFIGVAQDRSEIRRIFREYVQEHGHPEAVFCSNDSIALSIFRALLDLGLSVPGDTAIIGCDGLPEGEYLSAPLSTIEFPIEEMARNAWKFLKTRIDDRDAPPQRIDLQAKLVLRGSSEG